MTALIKKENLTLKLFIDNLSLGLSRLSLSTQKSYKKALGALRNYGYRQRRFTASVDSDMFDQWCTFLWFSGKSQKTILHYIDCIAGLCKKNISYRDFQGNDLFKNLKIKVKDFNFPPNSFRVTEKDFKKLINILAKEKYAKKYPEIFDVLKLSLLEGAKSLSEIGMWQKEDIKEINPEIISICKRHIEAKRKYVFALNQISMTPKQFEKFLNEKMTEYFKLVDLPLYGSVEETIKSFWIYSAIRQGELIGEVMDVVREIPVGMIGLGLCRPISIDNKKKNEIIKRVGEIFLHNSEEWFAMKLRPNVKYQQLEARFASLPHLKRPELFYPCEEITRKIGKRLIWMERPFIKDVVFFKARITEINSLFSQLFDLAWCYRNKNENNGNYAVIPGRSMELFQETIGKFTPEYEVAPSGELELKEGEKVVIISGDYKGNEGIIEGIIDDDSGSEFSPVYRIIFPDSSGFEWRVPVRPSQIKAL